MPSNPAVLLPSLLHLPEAPILHLSDLSEFCQTVTMRLLGKTRSGLHFFRRHFDLDEYPLRAMGFVVVIFITVVYLIALPFLLAG